MSNKWVSFDFPASFSERPQSFNLIAAGAHPACRGATHLNAGSKIDKMYPIVYKHLMRTIHTTEAFSTWFTGLRDRQAAVRIQVRIDRAEDGNFGDCAPVGEGVSEMRIHHGPGYRVYFIQRGMEVVILLAGGDKSTQSKDIKTALEIARQI